MISYEKISECRAAVISNGVISVKILPYDGGRVSSLVDQRTDTELVWSNPRTSSMLRYYNCNYDDTSASGIEEPFPTVQPCTVGDANLPFFGEIWNGVWDCEEDNEGLKLTRLSAAWPAEVTKKFYIDDTGNTLCVDYKIRNIGCAPFPYIFGFHPSLTLYPGTEIFVPDGDYDMYLDAEMNDKESHNVLPERFTWPYFHGRDMRFAEADNPNAFFNYLCCPCPKGRYGVRHRGRNTGIEINFDPSYFKCLSLWPIYGGWRGHNCLMTEAFTTWNAVLSDAVAEGRAYILNPGNTDETTVKYTIG